MTTVYGPDLVYNFVEFAGYNQSSNISYTFNDTISGNLTQATDSADFCGSKIFSFQLNSTSTKLFTGNNTEKITFSPPSSSTFFGN